MGGCLSLIHIFEAKLKNAVEIAESNLNIAQKTADGYKAILDKMCIRDSPRTVIQS